MWLRHRNQNYHSAQRTRRLLGAAERDKYCEHTIVSVHQGVSASTAKMVLFDEDPVEVKQHPYQTPDTHILKINTPCS